MELESCPFCGGKLLIEDNEFGFSVRCDWINNGCIGFESGIMTDKEQLIKTINRRA